MYVLVYSWKHTRSNVYKYHSKQSGLKRNKLLKSFLSTNSLKFNHIILCIPAALLRNSYWMYLDSIDFRNMETEINFKCRNYFFMNFKLNLQKSTK